MSKGKFPYKALSLSDREYAESLLDRIDAGEPVLYHKIKLKKNANGTFAEEGTEPWKRNDAAYKKWRENKERKRTRRAERKSKDKIIQGPLSTGPPTPINNQISDH
ncbi:hypothetical protein LQ948_18710 [Jiella sp. MQZ9-1]|uniref:Uncharacterized protein n=1 Tax=Jiella flava TaxID=2816857 RepID=A0A939FYX6_9HYPH|nr:hypothetical protein [Jiella flava]MBO0664583.1 hypothetical protein [Jiella flava]MCD2473221.1 hypothetical protein [Jiella flava]